MHVDESHHDWNHSSDPQQLVAKLGRRYLLVLVAVAVLVVLDQVVIQPLLVQLNFYAPVINVAGRQRMLSQKVSKAALAIELATEQESIIDRKRELKQALEIWSRAHQGLLAGDQELNLPHTNSPQIRHAFAKLQPHFDAILQAATNLSRTANAPPNAKQELQRILAHEVHYLPMMDRIVGLFEAEARRQIALLRLLGLSIMIAILLLLASVGWLVLRPALAAIRAQLSQLAENEIRLRSARDNLEVRVGTRTRELREANAALQREMQVREQAEAKTRNLSGQLAHASRVTAMGQLATGLAHELNQPMTAITLYSESAMLMASATPPNLPAAIDTLSRVKKSAMRAGNIIKRMRNFLRPTESRPAIIDLREVIRDVCELCEFELAAAEVDLHLQLDESLPSIEADSIQIQQVLVNLIQNAIVAMQSTATTHRRLQIDAVAVADEVQVAVRDTGKGFSADDADHLFEPFVSDNPNGLGMGLAISRAIVEQHRGRLDVDSEAGQGATFRISLPMTWGRVYAGAGADDLRCG